MKLVVFCPGSAPSSTPPAMPVLFELTAIAGEPTAVASVVVLAQPGRPEAEPRSAR